MNTEKLILEILPNTTSRLGRFVSQLHDFKRLKIIYDPSTLIKIHARAFFERENFFQRKNLDSHDLLALGHMHLLFDFVDHAIVHELVHAEIHEKRGTHPFLQHHFSFEETFLHKAYEKSFSTDELLAYSYASGFLAERLIKGSVKMKSVEFEELQHDIENLRAVTLATSEFNKELLQFFRFMLLGSWASPTLIRDGGVMLVLKGPWGGPFRIDMEQKANHLFRVSLETSQVQRAMEFSGPQWWGPFQKFKEDQVRSCSSDFCSFQTDSPHWPFFSKVMEEVQMRVMELEQVSGKIISILDQIADKQSTIDFMTEKPDSILVREYLELYLELKELASQQGLPKVEKFVEEYFSEEKKLTPSFLKKRVLSFWQNAKSLFPL